MTGATRQAGNASNHFLFFGLPLVSEVHERQKRYPIVYVSAYVFLHLTVAHKQISIEK